MVGSSFDFYVNLQSPQRVQFTYGWSGGYEKTSLQVLYWSGKLTLERDSVTEGILPPKTEAKTPKSRY
jgi:hypothetical protein